MLDYNGNLEEEPNTVTVCGIPRIMSDPTVNNE